MLEWLALHFCKLSHMYKVNDWSGPPSHKSCCDVNTYLFLIDHPHGFSSLDVFKYSSIQSSDKRIEGGANMINALVRHSFQEVQFKWLHWLQKLQVVRF